ncbi:hypothetical protein [Desulfitibacter alkalitolerans]|uniref:hypothetical protein n=1 Tax=Desulfitibacter alkalitolerans TaxID=264641 RepID=UPI000557158B|nr:hypothetical protein [Desulfitibacter alkalitolerans]
MIRDRIVLGILSGFVGNTAKTILDEISVKKKVSQRAFRSTAAGVFVSSKNEAQNMKGQLLGSLFDYGIGAIGGILIVELLSKRGRDHLATKGIISGISIGSFITFVLNTLPANKIKPKDAASNLSYMLSHAVYGLIAAYTASILGHKSIFSTNPANKTLPPTLKAAEEKNSSKNKSN